MKNLKSVVGICLLVVGITSCKQQPDTFKQLSTLEGKWLMQTPEGTMMEVWEITNDTLYSGKSYSIEGADTTLSETVQLIQRHDGIYYIPTVTNQNDGVPIPFKLITSEAGVFVFENPTHDFPTKITYKTDQKNKLSASISGKINGEERKIAFDYERVK
ncbi:MAG: hypothetical protein IPI23_13030 [Bacteroidetes bacterium]|nr:hypothetical protein [Bacteroidota bacterium]MBK7968776.1 hypothetical protein [Bacteroidota bacterium]MBK8416335.1 hypothetical protein [Bacteroidota bacterium]MBK9045546.1 hypothetical protein [Bacteroidota bacterium]